MRIIITGSAGLQGSHLGEYLLEAGHEVWGVDNYSRGTYEADWIAEGDLRDEADCNWIRRFKPEVVFHLAAQVWGAEYSKSHNWEMFVHNAQVDQNVLRACVEGGVKRVIYPSTACVYPVESQREWDSVLQEDMVWGDYRQDYSQVFWYLSRAVPGPHPESGYGWAKLIGEVAVKQLPIEWVIFRLFNVYGPGENASAESHVIPKLFSKVRAAPPGGVVKGLGNGNQGRSFLHVSDAVRAYQAALTCEPRTTMNIGNPEPVHIKDLAALIARIDGRGVKVEYDDSLSDTEVSKWPEIGVWGRTPDIREAKRVLGWEPLVSLEEGLKQTYAEGVRA